MKTATSSELAEILEKEAPHSRRRYLVAAIAIVTITVIGFWILRGRTAKANDSQPTFQTENLSRGNISLAITATGNLEPTNEVTVGSELSGIMAEVYVDLNDRVIKGQALAKLDTTNLDQEIQSSLAGLRSAEANLAQAKATLKESQANLSRLQDLHERSKGKLPSKADLDSAIASADRAAASVLVAEASVGEAEARLRIDKSDLEKAVIKSPIDGIVLSRAVEPGQTVAASFSAPELFVIAESLEKMKLIVNVAEADIGRLDSGQRADFTVDAWPNRSYRAEVKRVSFGSAVTNNVVTYETELSVDNADLSLRPGMTATATINVAESRDVYLVSTAALRFNPAQAGPANTGEKRTFVQSLTPMPPRRSNSRPDGTNADGPAKQASQIFVLREGAPQPITVTVGINDGRLAEVSSKELADGLPIVVRAL